MHIVCMQCSLVFQRCRIPFWEAQDGMAPPYARLGDSIAVIYTAILNTIVNRVDAKGFNDRWDSIIYPDTARRSETGQDALSAETLPGLPVAGRAGCLPDQPTPDVSLLLPGDQNAQSFREFVVTHESVLPGALQDG